MDVPMAGYQMMVRGEVIRGKYRNSYENPEAFKSGKVTQVKFTLPDITHTFKQGHKMMIQIQSSWFPLVDRNTQQFLNIYKAKDEDYIKATHKIYTSDQYPSSITAGVIE
jgi:predicted acyl esterase